MDSCDNLEVSLQILRGFMSNFGLKLFHPGRDWLCFWHLPKQAELVRGKNLLRDPRLVSSFGLACFGLFV